jgi:hypothetical protein
MRPHWTESGDQLLDRARSKLCSLVTQYTRAPTAVQARWDNWHDAQGNPCMEKCPWAARCGLVGAHLQARIA